jgi:hypothetical protein
LVNIYTFALDILNPSISMQFQSAGLNFTSTTSWSFSWPSGLSPLRRSLILSLREVFHTCVARRTVSRLVRSRSWGIHTAPQPFRTDLWRGAAFRVPSLLCSSLPTLRGIRVLRAGSSSYRAAGGALRDICWRQLSLLPLLPYSICDSLAGPGRLCRETDSLERVLGLLA